ncbi:hypothetical protein ABLO27_24445 [Roseibium sp. SCPC15]|uniref:hypothetical protein n=1 Tax=Roseibium sp. SCP15 TaxID=3141376 RepID=UPI003335FAB0
MTSSNQPENGKHGHFNQAEQRVSVSHIGLSTAEQTVLHSLRLFCMSYANPGYHAWEDAFESCAKTFGPEDGSKIGLAVMNAMRSLRQTRMTCFSFTNPGCPCCRHKLAKHEHQFMLLLKAVQNGDGLARQANAVILCEGVSSSKFLTHMEELAGHLIALAPAKEKSPSPAPRKRLKFTS